MIKGRVKPKRQPRRRVKSVSSMVSGLQSWYASLANTRLTPMLRAQDPFSNHAWVMAAAVTTAVVAAQAPFTVFHETPSEVARRARLAKEYGRSFRLRRGNKRSAIRRYVDKSMLTRAMVTHKSLEPDYDHELSTLLTHPNPHQLGSQLIQLTDLWLAVRGECFWVLEKDNGEPMMPGEIPDRIWPLSPDLFSPILSDGTFGELVGWSYAPAYYMNQRLRGMRINLGLDDIVQFKYPNPGDPLRGLSRLGAVALGIEIDMLAKAHNRAVIENGGDPGGVLMYDEMMEEEEEREFMTKWNQMHGGAENARRTALLSGGFKYASIALSPKDMQFLEQQKWDREEILAVMGVPRSVLGVPDQNYATQLGQDANFWDKTLLPLMKLIETTLDATLFHGEADDVVGLHDVRDVEALRVGINEKVETALKLADPKLRVPPRVAYDVVGLSVPEYEGDDIAMPSQAEQAVAALSRSTPLPPPVEESERETGDSLELVRHRVRRLKARRWEEFATVEEQAEARLADLWRKWNGQEKRIVLAQFDDLHKDAANAAFIPSEGEIAGRVAPTVRPFYSEALGATYEFTLEEIGVPVFSVDDQFITDVVHAREAGFSDITAQSLRGRLSDQLATWSQTDENLGALRSRIAGVFNTNASSAKTLTVARTEAGGYMNTARNAMFRAQGVIAEFWSTANDEHTRDTHKIYGQQKAMPAETDYLVFSVNAGQGKLAYPGDSRCTALGDIMNCRCLKTPA